MQAYDEVSLAVDRNTVATALRWLGDAGNRAGWPARTLFKLRLCLDEALTNTVLYGYQPKETGTPAPPPTVRLRLKEDDGRIVLTMMDNGVAFDPTARTSRELDVSLDDAKIGGHGLRLMRHYLEDIRYERSDRWNILQLTALRDESA